MKSPVIFHLVTWYPTINDKVSGIFIKRQIDLFSLRSNYQHIVIRKSKKKPKVSAVIKAILGFPSIQVVDSKNIFVLPNIDLTSIPAFLKTNISILILISIIIRYRPILFHLHVTTGFGTEVLFLKRKFGFKYIASEHMAPFPLPEITDPDKLVFIPLRNADKLICVSSALVNEISIFFERETIIIPNVVDEQIFRFLKKTPFGNTSIVSVGISSERKGTSSLIKAFSESHKSNSDLRLYLVGGCDSSRLQSLQAEIKNLDLSEVVFLVGCLDENQLNILFNSCHFYVCASSWESFGVSPLEALFTGLPVLTTDCGGPPLYINSFNGILVKGDPLVQNLALGIDKMIKNLENFDRKMISTDIRTRFNNSIIKEKYNRILESIL